VDFAAVAEPSDAGVVDEVGEQASIARETHVQVPVDVAQAVRKRARHSGKTNTAVVFEAIEATVERLAELVAASRPRPQGRLFSGPVSRKPEPISRTQLSIRPTPDDLAVIKRLCAEAQAYSVSELVTVALRQHLGVRPPLSQA